MSRREYLVLAGLLALNPAASHAADPPAAPAAPDAGGVEINLPELDVVARRLDLARQQIEPSLGATRTDFTPAALTALPQGADAALNQVLLRAPGVAEDSFGQVHLRGEHADIQYRIDGVQLPEGLSVFGQAIESRFAHSMSLLTGALPAQYGFNTAGVVDIQTKSGVTDPGLTIGVTGGSFGWLQPGFSYGGESGALDWFVTGDWMENNRGIENPAPAYNALHDATSQFHGLGKLEGIIDDSTRISLIYGGFDGSYQIPNNPGQVPTLGLNVNGVTNFNSSQLNERQQEQSQFAVLSLQKQIGDVDLQISGFGRLSQLAFQPDTLGDLLFNGIAQNAQRSDDAGGVQTDASWHVNEQHTLRAGFLVQQESSSYRTNSQVLPVDAIGVQTSTTPISVIDNGSASGGLYGAYLQDEWRLLPSLTLNYGARFDAVDEYTHESQLSPRVNLVWKADDATTFTLGYARYFAPPPFELVSSSDIAKFLGTTAAPSVTQDDTVRAERSDYFDAGVSRVVLPGLTLGVDAYYKSSHDLIDEGQFGAPIILSAFNYEKGKVSGAQATASYDSGGFSAYANLAYSRAMGKNIDSAQFNFSPDELAYIAGNYIHLDHDQTWTASAGVSYTLNRGAPHATLLSADMLYQSGLRASTATIPNGVALPGSVVLNLSVVQRVDLGVGRGTELRLDALNVADAVYEIRDGTGVGVGAPQYGLRRTVLASVTQHF